MYRNWFFIETPVGNNEFHYNERLALWSVGKIFVPNLIQWTVADLEEGSEIVFEEAENWKLVSSTWLKHFVQTKYQGIPTYIFDNHNHALFFRYRHTAQLKTPLIKGETKGDLQEQNKPFIVLHIDQHADTKENKNSFQATHTSPQEVFGFTTYACNVGNFLTSAKDAGIIEEYIQIRSEHALHTMQPLNFHEYNYILDIDVDFWEGKTDQEIKSDFTIIRKLVDNVCLITIATSPYFMEQKSNRTHQKDIDIKKAPKIRGKIINTHNLQTVHAKDAEIFFLFPIHHRSRDSASNGQQKKRFVLMCNKNVWEDSRHQISKPALL